jgi:hypothetical protein
MKTSEFEKKPMVFLFLLALVFSACSPLATPTPAAYSDHRPITVDPPG